MRIIAVILAMAATAAAVAGEPLAYGDGATELEGYLALPAAPAGRVPGVLIVHQWMGLTRHEREVADRLAGLGYAALAVDVYGKAARPANRQEAGAQAGKYKNDIPLYRQRLRAALAALQARPEVDPQRLAVIGYCFGGTGALELARGGAPLRATVSFHGGLATPHPEDAANIHGSVLVCHGGADKNVGDDELRGFLDEMRATDVDWQVLILAGAVHGFTHRHDPDRYHALADDRSWQAMRRLFARVVDR